MRENARKMASRNATKTTTESHFRTTKLQFSVRNTSSLNISQAFDLQTGTTFSIIYIIVKILKDPTLLMLNNKIILHTVFDA